MDAAEQIKPLRKFNKLAIVSFAIGLTTMIFPIISILYLIAVNGGPGYLQSLFCGIPVSFISIITGIVSLVQIRRNNHKGARMATLGIVFGILFFVIFCILVFILMAPFLFDGAG